MQKIIIDWNNPEQEIVLTEDSEVLGLFVGHDADIVKSKLKISHTKPHITSRIKIKAVVYDKSKFDIEALVAIPDGAAFTDTFLKIDCLVMSETASARAVPSLEIQEDEVKGGHGATVGMVDAEQIHYLMARGLGRARAESILVDAFIAEIAEQIG